jgi:aspartyl-tRNA(Asn)/glutamyl-tRNA(Gln) amidotransferase subunit A
VRSLIQHDFSSAFQEVDLLLSPTAPTPAFVRGEKTSPMDMYMTDIFTLSCNLAGLPGMSVPCGFSRAGLPIGMQLMARPLDEARLLAVAAAYEREVGAIGAGGVPVRRPARFAAAEVTP